MIYLDHAATSMNKPQAVYDAVLYAMKHAGNASRGSHAAALTSMRIIYAARKETAALFGLVNPEQVVFTANATESLNTAIKGVFTARDHVITTALEHNSVLRPLYELRAGGLDLTIIKADSRGNISYAEMEDAVKQNTKGIVCTHASNVTGNLMDLVKVGRICREHGLLFLVDAAQTAGIFPINMEEMHIDILCFTGHKSLLGPQGTGGICLREGVVIRPLKTGGSGIHTYDTGHPAFLPDALEAGTINVHGIAGLLAGIQYIQQQDASALLKKELEFMHQFYQGIKDRKGIHVYGDFKKNPRAPIVTFNINGYDSAAVADELNVRFQIAVRSGAHCAPLIHECLETRRQGAVRFSFSHSNTAAEVQAAIQAVRMLATEEAE